MASGKGQQILGREYQERVSKIGDGVFWVLDECLLLEKHGTIY
jgi:hypothetical protein